MVLQVLIDLLGSKALKKTTDQFRDGPALLDAGQHPPVDSGLFIAAVFAVNEFL